MMKLQLKELSST